MTFPIPNAALDDRLAIVGTAGSGKTFLALSAVEHLLHRKARVIFIDPLGVAWGLRLCADGKTPSPFQPVIFGGAHGDLPINEHAGALIGQAIATSPESCIIDFSQLGTKAAERRFMLALLAALYRDTNKEPVHLIIDEADMFAPQRLMDKEGDAAKLLGMMETIVRRGRVKGFVPWLLTQRPAVLSKDVLSQADGLVALKLTAKQDRDAIGGWIEGQADAAEGKAILASLPSKQRGEGVLWIPGRGILEHVAFPGKATFDSSRTPKRGERVQEATVKPIDLGALKSKLAAVEDEAKANDPRALKAEIAKLKGEIGKLSASVPVAKNNTGEIEAAKAEGFFAGWYEGDRAGWERGIGDANREWKATISRIDVTMPGYVAQAAPNKMVANYSNPIPAAVAHPGERRASNAKVASSSLAGRSSGHDDLTGPQRRILSSLAFWASVGHKAPTRAQVAAVAGYSPSSGGFNNLIGGLNTAGKVSIPQAGRVALATLYPGYSQAEAAEKMRSVLSAPQWKLVDVGLGFDKMTREQLAKATDYSANSGGFNNLIGSLCTLDILRKPGPGMVEISDWAREVLS